VVVLEIGTGTLLGKVEMLDPLPVCCVVVVDATPPGNAAECPWSPWPQAENTKEMANNVAPTMRRFDRLAGNRKRLIINLLPRASVTIPTSRIREVPK
jgi:hypothetical protein